jgi:divalent metal cation (Fe/Co/Zn/Cd) transporter
LIFNFIVETANAFGYFRRDYDLFDFMGMPYFGLLAGFGLIVFASALFLFIFWLCMLIDCLKRDFKKDVEKIVWVIVIIFLHIIGAIIYYFVVKINDKKIGKIKPKKK